jgi:ATP-dependent helicase/nuclease subunit B
MQPQLPLEAAIAEAGGFPGVPASPVAELTYWKLAGRGQADKPTSATGSEDPGKLAAEALAGLQRLIAAFDNEATTYIATPPGPWSRYDAYGHLARADEWSSGDDS